MYCVVVRTFDLPVYFVEVYSQEFRAVGSLVDYFCSFYTFPHQVYCYYAPFRVTVVYELNPSRFLSPVDKLAEESPEQYSQQVNAILSSQLGLKESIVTKKDIDNWFASLEPPPPPKPVIPSGPIIPPSEFDPAKLGSSKASPEIEAMVQQVTAVLPQVPHTVIRKDLCMCNCKTVNCPS